MNDADIIKALECCASSTTSEACNGCPLYSTTICTEMENGLQIYALDLINRQKAEIERLTDKVARLKESVGLMLNYDDGDERIKSEAIKKFAERLKQSAFDCDVSFGYGKEHYTEAVAVVEIDNLVKEMTEGTE
jgi:hypothetical protein